MVPVLKSFYSCLNDMLRCFEVWLTNSQINNVFTIGSQFIAFAKTVNADSVPNLEMLSAN